MIDNKIHIECIDIEQIIAFTGSNAPRRKYDDRVTIISADFELDDRTKFVRVSIVDKYGKFVDVRSFFGDGLEY